jgi:hypothetical protein
VRSETSGPLFERMELRIEAIASYCGLKGVFKLRAADVYEVQAIEPAEEETGRPQQPDASRAQAPGAIFTLQALQDLSSRIQRADSLDTLVDSILAGLEESFGFRNSMILVPSEEEGVLVTLATRGYADSGAGAEVRVGEGICGMVAEARKPIRISGLLRGMLYAQASHSAGRGDGPAHRIPLPGLAQPESQLGVPLLVRGELIGVLCVESETRYRFHEEDKQSIELLGSYVAVAIQNMQLQERAADALADAPPVAATQPIAAPAAPPRQRSPRRRSIVFYAADECIMVDGDYLIRSLPAKILWRLLTIRDSTGRDEFTNRELRLDKSLNLPEWKDNLESRLLLLRRRLDEKCLDMRLVPRARGRFALEVNCEAVLSSRP